MTQHYHSRKSYRKEHVFLILVDGTGVRHWVCVFYYGYRLPCQDGLVHSQSSRAYGGQSDICWDFITNWRKGMAKKEKRGHHVIFVKDVM